MATTGIIRMSGGQVAAATDYDYRHRTSSVAAWTSQTTSAIPRHEFDITGLSAGRYEIQTRARNANGPGPWSASVFATVVTVAAPSVPSLRFDGYDIIVVPDSGGASADSYNIRYREGSTGAYTTASRVTTKTTITLNGVVEAQVQAVNTGGNSAWSGTFTRPPRAAYAIGELPLWGFALSYPRRSDFEYGRPETVAPIPTSAVSVRVLSWIRTRTRTSDPIVAPTLSETPTYTDVCVLNNSLQNDNSGSMGRRWVCGRTRLSRQSFTRIYAAARYENTHGVGPYGVIVSVDGAV